MLDESNEKTSLIKCYMDHAKVNMFKMFLSSSNNMYATFDAAFVQQMLHQKLHLFDQRLSGKTLTLLRFINFRTRGKWKRLSLSPIAIIANPKF